MSRALPVMLAALILCASPTPAQKRDFLKTGPPEPPSDKASENTDYDVVDGLPATFTGALDADDSTYNRQAGDCGGLSGVGTNVFYDTITLTNTSGILATLDVTTSDVGDPASCTSGDTYLAVYSPSFNAVDPVTNCLTGDDDGGPGVCSSVSFDLDPGAAAVMVVSSFGNGAEFDYQVNLDTPSCSDGIQYDDGSLEGGLRGPMGTNTFEITQRFDLPFIGSQGGEVKRVCACVSHTLSAVDDFPLNIVVRRPTAGDLPGSRLHTEPVATMDVPEFPTCQFFTVDLAGVAFDSDTLFIGLEWDQQQHPELLIGEDTDGPESQPSFFSTNQGASWAEATNLDPAYRNLAVRTVFEEPFESLSSLSGLLLPGYEIDLSNPGGGTSFFNVRNTTDLTKEVNASYFDPEVGPVPLRVDGITLLPQQVVPVNVRTDTTDLDPDGDDMATGLVLVSRVDTSDAADLEGDFLNVDFGNDFATGERMFRVPDDFCSSVEIRFIDFGSGTRFAVVLSEPKGDVAASFTYTAYLENGTEIEAGSYYTNTHLNLIDAAELTGPGNPFGTVVFDFSNAGGGLAIGKYSAFGRFSVEFQGACRD